MRLLSMILVVLFYVGCASGSADEGESGTTSGDDSGEHGTPEPEPAVAVTALPPEPSPSNSDATAEDPPNNEEGLAELGEAMASAQNPNDSFCQQAYDGAMAMVAALSRRGSSTPLANLPSEQSFLAGCNVLSEQAQQCMTMSYAMANQATCSAVMQTPEVQAFRNQMRPQP